VEIASLVISFISLALSTLVAIVVARNQWREKRRDTCLKLWELWTSYEVKQSRSRAYQYLQLQAKESTNINLVALRRDQPNLSEDFSVVFHFFKDLNIMVHRGEVDRSLAKQLFMNEVDEWFRFLLNPKITKITKIIWEDEHENWVPKFVIPLQQELKDCPDKPSWF